MYTLQKRWPTTTMKKGYYSKKSVYGEDPLKEIIYEIEDKLFIGDEWEGKVVLHKDLQLIFARHLETVKEHRQRLKENKT